MTFSFKFNNNMEDESENSSIKKWLMTVREVECQETLPNSTNKMNATNKRNSEEAESSILTHSTPKSSTSKVTTRSQTKKLNGSLHPSDSASKVSSRSQSSTVNAKIRKAVILARLESQKKISQLEEEQAKVRAEFERMVVEQTQIREEQERKFLQQLQEAKLKAELRETIVQLSDEENGGGSVCESDYDIHDYSEMDFASRSDENMFNKFFRTSSTFSLESPLIRVTLGILCGGLTSFVSKKYSKAATWKIGAGLVLLQITRPTKDLSYAMKKMDRRFTLTSLLQDIPSDGQTTVGTVVKEIRNLVNRNVLVRLSFTAGFLLGATLW